MQFTNAQKYKKQVKKLYRSAFPANERAPFSLLFHRRDNGRDTFYSIEDNDEFVGLAYTIKSEKMIYVFFLAVADEKRGNGYGTKILDAIKKENPEKTVTLMIEDTSITDADNYDERIRRLDFYERNGFKKLGVKINEAGVDYELLGTRENIVLKDFLAMMKDWLGAFLFKIIYRKMNLK